VSSEVSEYLTIWFSINRNSRRVKRRFGTYNSSRFSAGR
jgi:hypothetical protein